MKMHLNIILNAQALVKNEITSSKLLADIYINKARIYTLQKSFNSAIEYFEKGIRIYSGLRINDKDLFQSLSSAYLNFGIVYYGINSINLARENFSKSVDIRIRHNLPGIALVYLNIAKCFVKTNDRAKADEFYNKSISSFIKEFGDGYYQNGRSILRLWNFPPVRRETRRCLGITSESTCNLSAKLWYKKYAGIIILQVNR